MLTNPIRTFILLAAFPIASLLNENLSAQPAPRRAETSLEQRIQAVIQRPEFAHSNFGIEFYSLASHRVIYQLHPDTLMVPGSTTKLLTEGTVLELLGAD